MPSWDADQSPADFNAIRLKASRFNITIIQAYAPTTDYDDDDVEDFYDLLREVIDQAPKKDILVVQGNWNAKIEDVSKNWKGTCGQYCYPEINERGLRLLEFASYNNLKVANTSGPHKPSRRWTWHSPGGDYHNQIDYNMVKRRFQSSVNIVKTRSFPGAFIGCDHELVMITFRLRFQRVKTQGSIRIRFSLEILDKLKDPNIAGFSRAALGGKFAPLHALENQDTETDALINSFNTAVTETAKTANNILGEHRPAKKPWVTDNMVKLCDKRRELKQKKNATEGSKLYREANQQVKNGMRKAKETWIEEQCQGIEENLQKNNSKKTYQHVKELISSKQGRTTTIHDKAGKCLTEEQEVLKRWTEYCSELYTHVSTGDPKVVDVPPPINNDSYPVPLEEVEAAVKSLKKGKSAGVNKIPSELVQAGGEAMINMLLVICNTIWQTREWPTHWSQP